MFESTNTRPNKLQITAVILLIIACLLALPYIVLLMTPPPTVKAASADSGPSFGEDMNDSPNLVTAGVFTASSSLAKTVNSTQNKVIQASEVAAKSISTVATASGQFVVDAAATGASAAINGTKSGIGLVVRGGGNAADIITNPTKLGLVIRPAEASTVAVPVIDAPTLAQQETIALAVKNSNNTASQAQSNTKWQWPLHGAVTLEYGVPHWPYQQTHTGIDISDGRLGVTPVMAVSTGTVVQVINSRVGLGNHVVVDHGGGVISVYGHLASISSKVGQKVEAGTPLGYEGSTGASTGAHVHLEILVNGQNVDPRKYITGQP